MLQLLIYAKYKRLLWCYVANRTLVRATKTAVITRIGRWVQNYTYDIVLILSEITVFMFVFPEIPTVQKLYMYKHYHGQSTKLEVRNIKNIKHNLT